jgi:hypothetical protein
MFCFFALLLFGYCVGEKKGRRWAYVRRFTPVKRGGETDNKREGGGGG